MQLFCPLMAVLALFVPTVAAGQGLPHLMPVPCDERVAKPSYASVKTTLLRATRRGDITTYIPGPYPARGFILAQLGFGGFGSWTAVDLDRCMIERFNQTFSPTSDGESTAGLNGRVGRQLSNGEVNNIIEKANDIWNPPPVRSESPAIVSPTDPPGCKVALFDDRDVIFDFGRSCLARTEHLSKLLDTITTGTSLR